MRLYYKIVNFILAVSNKIVIFKRAHFNKIVNFDIQYVSQDEVCQSRASELVITHDIQ